KPETTAGDPGEDSPHGAACRTARARHDRHDAVAVERGFQRVFVLVDDDVRAHWQPGDAERFGEPGGIGVARAVERYASAHEADASRHGHPVTARRTISTSSA